MAQTDDGCAIIASVQEVPGCSAMRLVLGRLQELGAATLVVGDPDSGRLGTVALPLPDLGPEHLSPLLLILPLQQLAWHLAVNRGGDPDRPRGLHKVTETW